MTTNQQSLRERETNYYIELAWNPSRPSLQTKTRDGEKRERAKREGLERGRWAKPLFLDTPLSPLLSLPTEPVSIHIEV